MDMILKVRNRVTQKTFQAEQQQKHSAEACGDKTPGKVAEHQLTQLKFIRLGENMGH